MSGKLRSRVLAAMVVFALLVAVPVVPAGAAEPEGGRRGTGSVNPALPAVIQKSRPGINAPVQVEVKQPKAGALEEFNNLCWPI